MSEIDLTIPDFLRKAPHPQPALCDAPVPIPAFSVTVQPVEVPAAWAAPAQPVPCVEDAPVEKRRGSLPQVEPSYRTNMDGPASAKPVLDFSKPAKDGAPTRAEMEAAPHTRPAKDGAPVQMDLLDTQADLEDWLDKAGG